MSSSDIVTRDNKAEAKVLLFFSIPESAKKKLRISCGTAVIMAQNDSKKVTTDWGDKNLVSFHFRRIMLSN